MGDEYDPVMIPLRFERDVNWTLGDRWMYGRRWIVEITRLAATVYQAEGGRFEVADRFGLSGLTLDVLHNPEAYVAKWIAAAVVKASKKTRLLAGIDPFIAKGRPAIEEFMLELESSPGEPREPSILMITVSENGLRVGLKDEGAGGWLWREADSLAEALDAIEKALQSGKVRWSTPQKGRGKK